MKATIRIGAILVLLGTSSLADPPNAARLDGRPTEYDGTDLRGTFVGAATWGNDAVITNLYVTWDATNLYVALQAWENNNKMVVMLDVDPGNGTGASTTTNWTGVTPDYVRYNDVGWQRSDAVGAVDFGLDYMFASEGFFHDILRITYDGDALDTNAVAQVLGASGSDPHGGATDIVAREDNTACNLKGLEVRIPWSELYNTNRFGTVEPGEVVPRGATLRLFANIHNNDPNIAYSSPDTIPNQASPNSDYDNGLLTTDTYIDVPLDQDNDGIPDLAVGDVNAPYLIMLQGLSGKSNLFAMFNEAFATNTAELAANWSVNGAVPVNVAVLQDNAVLLNLPAALPDGATLVNVTASGVEDTTGNSKTARLCFFPTSGGIETAVTVRFYLETSSGLGVNPGASNFFINGSAAPLEWGNPPAMSSKLGLNAGTLFYRDVTFPAGTPQAVYYKYSGQLSSGTGRGTNNYEAVRLHRYADMSRELTLNTLGTPMVVTDYLGAAAHPWRDPNDTNRAGYNALYADTRRGDAGVRQRTSILFQLDLAQRDLRDVTRVLVLGTDPLRGFNLNNEPTPVSDYPTAPVMSWNTAGLTLYDNGTQGDLVAGDGIYSRLWTWATNGLDSATVATWPHSLVGGGELDEPYYGTDFWAARRSPRSFAYKFAVYKHDPDPLLARAYESPSYDLEQYLQLSSTSVVLTPFVWDNPALPLPAPSNAPTMVDVLVSNATAYVLFTNVASEAQHGVEVSTNLAAGWADFGARANAEGGGLWEAIVQDAGWAYGHFRAYAGAGPARVRTWWQPNPIPQTGGTVRIWFSQINRNLAGRRDVELWSNLQTDGSLNDAAWTNHPMTFASNGLWYADRWVNEIPAGSTGIIRFVFRNTAASIWDSDYGYPGADQYRAHIGGRASWTPDPVKTGAVLTVNYKAAGGPLEGTNVWLHAGFDKFEGTDWSGTIETAMTETVENEWTVEITVPSNYTKTVNFLFRNEGMTIWDNFNDPVHWGAFIAQPGE